MLIKRNCDNCRSRRYWKVHKINGVDFLTANLSSNRKRGGLHMHHGYTISIVEKGILPLCFKEDQIHLKPGEILLLGSEIPHTFDFNYCNKLCLYRTVFIKPEILGNKIIKEKSSISCFYNKKLWRIFLITQKKIELGLNKDLILFNQLLKEIFTAMPNNVINRNLINSEPILNIKRYINNNYKSSPSIENLAKIVNFSPKYLLKLFKNEVGITPHAYINQLKINEAKKMIDAGIPLLEITYELGFVDQAHFSKAFLKATGVNPRDYGAI